MDFEDGEAAAQVAGLMDEARPLVVGFIEGVFEDNVAAGPQPAPLTDELEDGFALPVAVRRPNEDKIGGLDGPLEKSHHITLDEAGLRGESPGFGEPLEVGEDLGVFFHEGAGSGAAGEELQAYGTASGKKVDNSFSCEGSTGFEAIEKAFPGSFGEGTRMRATRKRNRPSPPLTPQYPHPAPRR